MPSVVRRRRGRRIWYIFHPVWACAKCAMNDIGSQRQIEKYKMLITTANKWSILSTRKGNHSQLIESNRTESISTTNKRKSTQNTSWLRIKEK